MINPIAHYFYYEPVPILSKKHNHHNILLGVIFSSGLLKSLQGTIFFTYRLEAKTTASNAFDELVKSFRVYY